MGSDDTSISMPEGRGGWDAGQGGATGSREGGEQSGGSVPKMMHDNKIRESLCAHRLRRD